MRTTRDVSRKFRSIASIAIVTLATLALAACGGGGGSSTAGPPLSKADYIKAANAVCATADAKIKAITEPTNLDTGAWKTYLDQLVPAFATEVANLKALTPPTADKATIDSLLALVDSIEKAAKTARSAAAVGDSNALQTALNAVASPSREADQISNTYGLDVCGEEN